MNTVNKSISEAAIYLDYASTTPVWPEVIEAMRTALGFEGEFGNAASRSHAFGWRAEEMVERARQQLADCIGADPREIVFTSGATESNNLALKGTAAFLSAQGRHIVSSATEHKSVLDVLQWLQGQGFEITLLSPKPDGRIALDELEKALRPDTILVSLMWANNEIGVLQPIDEVAQLCRARSIRFHTDATQAISTQAIDVHRLGIDLLSFSGHKIYGPKGIGALYVSRQPRVRLAPQMHGGGHERGFRSGTLPVHQIVGLGVACDWIRKHRQAYAEHCARLKEQLWQALVGLEGVQLNGSLENTLPTILNLSFLDVEGESLMMAMEPIAVSSGSACTSSALEPSYVLKALGVADEVAHSSIRFSFGYWTQKEDIERVACKVREAVARLRTLSPLWEMRQAGTLSEVQWCQP